MMSVTSYWGAFSVRFFIPLFISCSGTKIQLRQEIIKVANSMQGQKQLAMKLKLEWDQDGGHKVETGQLSNFPPNL